jgi:hypothetical protein
VQPLFKILKKILIPKKPKYSTIGIKAAVSIVIVKEAPISLYHSYVKSVYYPLLNKGIQKSMLYLKFAFPKRRRIAVLKNYATKILVIITLAS